MPRRAAAQLRPIEPDAIHRNRLVQQVINKVMSDGKKSIAVEVTLQPREKTLTDAEIEALSARIVAAAEKAVGAKLRG